MSRHRLPRYVEVVDPIEIEDRVYETVQSYLHREYDTYRPRLTVLLDRSAEIPDALWTLFLDALDRMDADDVRGGIEPWQPYPPSERVVRTLARWAKRREAADD